MESSLGKTPKGGTHQGWQIQLHQTPNKQYNVGWVLINELLRSEKWKAAIIKIGVDWPDIYSWVVRNNNEKEQGSNLF
jgi:hypothetical protein